jgi:hypothetical protein
VQVSKGQNEFGNIESGSLLRELGLTLEVPEELASALEIGDEVEILIGLEAELETYKEGGFEGTLKDLALANDMSDLLFGDDLLLGQDFHGVDALGILLADLEDFAESATADKLEELKVARGEGMLCFDLLKGDLDAHLAGNGLILVRTESG